jgi:predicted nucleic acid-binding protein
VIVITDTSVILNLCFLQQEALLPLLYGEILAPPEVRDEFRRLSACDPRFSGLQFPRFVRIQSPGGTPASLLGNRKLDPGELAALSLAVELSADLVLIDERAGRHSADLLGLTST